MNASLINSSRRHRRRLFGWLSILPLGALAGAQTRAQTRLPEQTRRDASPAMPRIPDISLLDQDGRTVRLRDLVADGVVAINFIYTGCASFCPPQTAVFRDLRERLDAEPTIQATLLSISIDPVNDTPSALSAYAERFDVVLGEHSRWLMLTGRLSDIDRVLIAFGVHRGSLEDHPAQVWLGHSTNRRWRRALGLASAVDLMRWIRELDG